MVIESRDRVAREYDAFEHLCSSIFSSKRDLFAMLTAYFDDSGDSDVAVVAGYLATTKMWDEYNQRWASLLTKYGIEQLHRSELESFKGEFQGWTPDQRKEFIIKANAIIKKHTYLPIGIAIIKKDFETVFPPGHIARRFGFYSWCVHICLAWLGKWCKAKGHCEPINFVFEAGTQGQGQVNQAFSFLYANPGIRPSGACPIKTWTFAGKDVVPLQAADVVAYEHYKLVKNEVIDNGKRNVRYSAINLFRPPVDISLLGYFDQKALEALRGENVPGWGNM